LSAIIPLKSPIFLAFLSFSLFIREKLFVKAYIQKVLISKIRIESPVYYKKARLIGLFGFVPFLLLYFISNRHEAIIYSSVLRSAKHTASTWSSVITPEKGSARLSSANRSVTGKSPG
jgi:hypothetical protein